MNENTITHSDDIALLIWGAFRHPDLKVRASLRRTHDRWIQSCGPRYDREEVREALLRAEGTFLEPYSFPNEVLEEAVSLAQVAFSKAYGAQRIHIASASPALPASGMIFTAGLGHACIERYALGRLRRPPRTAWHLSPMHFPRATRSVPGFPKMAILVCGEEGFEIRIRWPGQIGDTYGVARELPLQSRLSGTDRDLHDLGLSVRNGKGRDRFCIFTTSPESMIRFMGMLEEGRELMLDAGDISQNSVRVTLVPAVEGPPYTRLPARIYTKGAGLPWIRAMQSPSEGTAPCIRAADKAALAKYFPYPLEWREEVQPILDAA